jgi:outer membrane protein, multidrug efflux system
MNKHKSGYFLIILGVTALLLKGCSAGKNYERSDLGIPPTYSANASAEDTSLAARPWREFFSDSILVSFIDRALLNNFDIQLAIKRVDVYQSLAKQARAEWLPTLHVQASGSTVNPSGKSLSGISLENFLGTDHLEDYTLSANLSWEIDVWGKIRRKNEASHADYLESYEVRKAVQTSLITQVADAYYNLLMMESQLAVARRTVQLNDSTVRMIELQKTAGEVTSLAVEQSLAQKQRAELLVQQLEEAKQLQQNGLRLLLGDYPGDVALNRSLYELSPNVTLATGVPADVLRFRPDVRASEQALVAANARVGVAQASLYPSLSLTAAGGLNAFRASDWFNTPASLFGTVAGNLVQPVFARRALKTNLEVAHTQRDQRAIEFRQSVTVAVHDVVNALIKLDKLKNQQLIASQRVETLDRAVINAQLLFRSGLANYLEVLTAQRTALDANLEKAIITRQQLSAHVELYKSLGGGAF